mmetsp:Transcript_21629/g.46887  ORF Transcript_21629/g.46887 Transcript_21629/m.46887 type:complete len:306 (+) Transcript_21629:253-1170(+)
MEPPGDTPSKIYRAVPSDASAVHAGGEFFICFCRSTQCPTTAENSSAASFLGSRPMSYGGMRGTNLCRAERRAALAGLGPDWGWAWGCTSSMAVSTAVRREPHTRATLSCSVRPIPLSVPSIARARSVTVSRAWASAGPGLCSGRVPSTLMRLSATAASRGGYCRPIVLQIAVLMLILMAATASPWPSCASASTWGRKASKLAALEASPLQAWKILSSSLSRFSLETAKKDSPVVAAERASISSTRKTSLTCGARIAITLLSLAMCGLSSTTAPSAFSLASYRGSLSKMLLTKASLNSADICSCK